MAHQSGIPVSKTLDESFGHARSSGNVRLLQIEIQDDTLVETKQVPVSHNFEQDFRKVVDLLEGKNPCYVVVRLDTKNIHGFEWMLCSYVPDGSPVKQRMLYASTREVLKRQLGTNFFSDDMHGSSTEDFTWEAYLSHATRTIDAPLTEAEKVASLESNMEIDHGHTREYVHSVKFPVSRDAIDALSKIGGKYNLVQLGVDATKETVELLSAQESSVEKLANIIPNDSPTYNFFRFDHEFGGIDQSSIVFIYSCPDSANVKLKMLYSTVKAPDTQAAESAGVVIAKKLEITESNEVSRELLFDELHPTVDKGVKKFIRPLRAGRGRPRMTKQ